MLYLTNRGCEWATTMGDWDEQITSLVNLIRPTPLVRLNSCPGVLLKCEHENPSGSHKDRAYVRMLSQMDRVRLADTLVDYTTGNGGISLALFAGYLGKRAVIFMPDGMTPQRARLIRQHDAQLVITPRGEFIRGARKAAEEFVSAQPDAVLLNQSDNVSNRRAYIKVGEEIVRQCRELEIRPRAFVCGIGTGGTFSGISMALKDQLQHVDCIAIEAAEAPVIWAKRNAEAVAPGIPSIIGFGAGLISLNTDETLIDDVEVISAQAVQDTLIRLQKLDGLKVGPSTAANVLVAYKVAQERHVPVVTLSFDRGDRYP